MRIRSGQIPTPDQDAKLKPADFSDVLWAVPADCVLIGGQAVAWWAARFGIKSVVGGQEHEVTSRDIDFWGTQADLFHIASCLNRDPTIPNFHEMTLLVGAIELTVAGRKTTLEILHAVPGLDSNNPMTAAVPEEIKAASRKQTLLVLSPVSLVLAKLHALRHFPQQDRQDLLHLQVCLEASKAFISEALKSNPRLALWSCNRLIDSHRRQPIRQLEQKHGFQILDAIPIEHIQTAAQEKGNLLEEDRERLLRFLRIQWPRVLGVDQAKD